MFENFYTIFLVWVLVVVALRVLQAVSNSIRKDNKINDSNMSPAEKKKARTSIWLYMTYYPIIFICVIAIGINVNNLLDSKKKY